MSLSESVRVSQSESVLVSLYWSTICMEKAMSRLVLSRKVGIRRVSVVIPDFPGSLPGC